jgi:hypothetical protein
MFFSALQMLARAVFWFGFLFCFISALVCFWLQLRNALRSANARSWPTASGTITRVDIQKLVTRDIDNYENVTYKPILEYDFAAAGRLYKASRVRFGSGIYTSSLKWVSTRYLRQFQAGMPVTVHYNPADPGDSVLNPESTGWEHAFMGAIFLAFAAVAWFFVLFRN